MTAITLNQTADHKYFVEATINPSDTTNEYSLEGEDPELDAQKQRTKEAIEKTQTLINENPKTSGFQYLLDQQKKLYNEAEKMCKDSSMHDLLIQEFKDITTEVQKVENQIREKYGIAQEEEQDEPAYVREKRVPKVEETFLVTGGYRRTGREYDGKPIFTNIDGHYFYIDNFHEGKAAEIEWFDAHGRHLGTLDPSDGTKKGGPDSTKSLKL